MAQIGIRLADGTFYHVMDDDAPRRVRVLLSPAQVGQSGVQIDIIRRDGDTDQYAGCLVLENLQLPEGADLEFVLGLDREGTLDARVGDTSGERYQSLSVSLTHLEEPGLFSMPDDADSLSLGVGDAGMPEDLDFSDDGMPDVSMPDLDEIDEIEFSDAPEDDYEAGALETDDYETDDYETDDYEPDFADGEDGDEEYSHLEERPFNPVILVAIILITLSLLALGAYGVLRILGASMLPELRASSLLLLGTSSVPSVSRARSGAPDR